MIPTDPATPPPRRAYHHGNLRAAVIEATVRLVEERGAEHVTVREAARRAGVSSGAPFRHFPTKVALMTAVAEEGMTQLATAIDHRLSQMEDSPFIRLSAIGDAYFRWAVGNPTHYRVLGDRPLIDFEGSRVLSGHAAAIRETMRQLIAAAFDAGRLRPCDPDLVHLQARALAYGLARMHVDAHLREWDIPRERAVAAMRSVMDDYIISLARDPQAARADLERAAEASPA